MDGQVYTVYLELAGLGALDDASCAAAGAGPKCVGILTQEDQVNGFDTRFRITKSVIVKWLKRLGNSVN